MSKTKKKLLIVASFGIPLIIVAGLSILFSLAFPMPYSTILSVGAGLAGGCVQGICFENIMED